MSRGQWYRYNAKTAVEHSQRLDIRRLKKIKTGSSVTLKYKFKSKTFNENVILDWTPCYLGGKRPWWLCPGCGKRVAILYLKESGYRCRECYNLTYRSSQESQFDRHLRKKFKICDQLGIGPIEKPLFKPKYMHQKTFDRLRRQHMLAKEIATKDLAVAFELLEKIKHIKR